MADVFDEKKRSHVMSLIRSKNTKAELLAFAHLKKNKIYFQKHYKRAVGKPDIALPRKKRAVFIDSDFWHGRTYEQLIKRRRNINDYWVNKIAANIKRDEQQRRLLKEKGWKILVVWEEDINRKSSRTRKLEEIEHFLKS